MEVSVKSKGPPVGNSWSFGILVAGGLTLAGIAADLALGGRGFPAPAWPDNALFLATFVVFQILVWAALRQTVLFEGLAGERLAVVTLAAIGLWAVFLGSFPQVERGENALIFQRVMQAPPFVFLILFLICNLAWVILKRIGQGWQMSSLFLANHLGVYLVASAALFGSGDVIRLDVWVREKEMAWAGTHGKHAYELPFALHLHQFGIEYFPAQLTVLNAESGEILLPRGADLMTLHPGSEGALLEYRIQVSHSTLEAPWSIPGDAIPAAYLTVTDPAGNQAAGWVSCGSSLMPPVFLNLGQVTFAMPVPRARLYESDLTVVQPEAEPRRATIRVNQPLRIAGWWLYQKGYNTDGGPAARFSQIEAVRDPWLPLVYAGFALMALGAMLALGRAAGLLRVLKTLPGGSL